jgi:hypothetical protein
LLKLPSYSVAAKQLLSVVVAENSISLISWFVILFICTQKCNCACLQFIGRILLAESPV